MRAGPGIMGLILFGGFGLLVIGHEATAIDSNGPPRTNVPDLAALHDPNSPSFQQNCLGCHADVMNRRTLNKKIKDAHAAMIPYAPGYDPKTGATNQVCIGCHTNVDVLQHSAGQIRKNVSMTLCAACHNKEGPSSKKFYAN